MRAFVGVKHGNGNRVYVVDDANPGAPQQRLRCPLVRWGFRGFDWGCERAGAVDLACAIVAQVTGDPDPSPRTYHTLKARLIRALPEQWTLTEDFMRRQIEQIVREQQKGDGNGSNPNHDSKAARTSTQAQTDPGPASAATRGQTSIEPP